VERARFIVGVDLGTTNCVVAYVDTRGGGRELALFEVPQRISEHEVRPRPMLPSFLYLAGEHDLPAGATSLPWDAERRFVVGEFARAQGARVPGRLVTSAKSWLCHAGVDRTARILPWAALPEVPRLSPVDASARYLAHIREAWDHEMAPRFKGARLADQDIVLTVPASFDEVARELTVQAARAAGLTRLTLIEEPQAAFYAWIKTHEDEWRDIVDEGQQILVCDIGGGTTDFTLISVKEGEAGLEFERTAVGDHLLLGGDNMDIMLARDVEARLTAAHLDATQWHALVHACRLAKEELLTDRDRQQVPVTIAGRGARVIGGTLRDRLERDEVVRLIAEKFFPACDRDARPAEAEPGAPLEFGLPLAADPAVTRHLLAFLKRHSTGVEREGIARPDVVLFNGGVVKSDIVRERLIGAISTWYPRAHAAGWKPQELPNPDPDLAVALGAAYYGLVRRGQGVRIRGGAARAYYVGIEAAGASPRTEGGPAGALGVSPTVTVACLIPRGLEEGETVDIEGRTFLLLTNRPVSFRLFASSTRQKDQPGEVIAAPASDFAELPPIHTVLRAPAGVTEVPVQVGATATEIGTLELYCAAAADPQTRWKLEFEVRAAASTSTPTPDRGDTPGAEQPTPTSAEISSGGASAPEPPVPNDAAAPVDDAAVARAVAVVRAFVAGRPDAAPAQVLKGLEEALTTRRDQLSTPVLRALWEPLLEGASIRGRSPEHEARWLNLAGFFLRPGFGYPLDDWRVRDLWKVYGEGLEHEKDDRCVLASWILLRRVAAGLRRGQQEQLFTRLAPTLVPGEGRKAKKRRASSREELIEMWRTAASLERLQAPVRAQLGEALMERVERGKDLDFALWALARVGARVPFYGPLNGVVGKEVAERWVARLLQAPWPQPQAAAGALAQIARRTGDRGRDLDEALRASVLEKLRPLDPGGRLARLVSDVVALEDTEQRYVFGDTLPAGLRLVSDADLDRADLEST
jgi:molecular chaperone DnaK (HSP70)